MVSRFQTARSIFDRQAFFKIVCGAGNEDPVEVERLATVYTLAGASGIDLSANPAIVQSAVKGIQRAESLAENWGQEKPARPFITVSVGIAGDPHVRKGSIDPGLCIRCGQCIPACEQAAIGENFTVIQERCIGCGKCSDVCELSAIVFVTRRRDLQSLLPECLSAGAEMIELHAVTPDDDAVLSDWNYISSLNRENYISMCLDRSILSDHHLARRIQDAFEVSGDRMIVQADGAPMSGGSDDFRTTLQAIATADIVEKTGIPVKILASGGTNSKTMELADLCGVHVHGVSIGTFARKIIRPYIESADFDHNDQIIQQAVTIAQNLVRLSCHRQNT